MIRRISLVVLSIFALGGCRDGGSTGPSSSVAGTYELQAVNGQPRPFTLAESEGYREELTAAILTLNQNQTFSNTLTLRTTVDGVSTMGTET